MSSSRAPSPQHRQQHSGEEDAQLHTSSEQKRQKISGMGSVGEAAKDAFVEEVEQKVLSGEAAAPLSIQHEVRHEVAVPEGYDYVPLHKHVPTGPPAREYPFALDPFQRLAITCLERQESVLVSAHTSAGKTVVAEYAIAMALRDKQRVIYTSPIKALSNQKYRELQEIFGDVGLMTGDVTINQDASALVMTTEILRSMLYRGSEVLREVAWVIFDEIHYMRDKERGVVWEETLIMLPNTVHYVFLSATIPNAKQFARWICDLHAQPCHVVYTNYRPTPLQHYLYPQGADGLYLVVDEKGAFKEENFQRALNVFGDRQDDTDVLGEVRRRRGGGGGGRGEGSELYRIVKMITSRNYHPVIVFSFSKKDCEKYAMQMSKLDFNTEEEKRLLMGVFRNALESLSEEDRGLPQIESIVPLLKRGIGIHHGGLLPILKEVIEILFQEGLVKVLFATETFSIGLNMPAKTVLFTSVRKFDGKDFRWISSGEYIQMSGRAGRRGLDDRGIVIMMLNEKMDPLVCKGMIKGQADALNSAFYLAYNMILNLMRVDGSSPETMLEKSFLQFQNADCIPDLQSQIDGLRREQASIAVPDEARVAHYHALRQKTENLRADYRRVVNHQSYALPFLQPGRLVRVRDGDTAYGWCCIVNVQKRAAGGAGKGQRERVAAPQYIVEVLALCQRGPENAVQVGPPKPARSLAEGEPRIIPVSMGVFDGLSSIRLHLPHELKSLDARTGILRNIQEVQRRFPDGVPLLDPVVDMKIRDESFRKLVERIDAMGQELRSHPVAAMDASVLAAYADKMRLEDAVKALGRQVRQANSVLQMEELKARKAVLRRLAFTNDEDVIQMKGRVACEVSTGDELLLTELMFAGGFNDLTPEQMVAMLSCFVCEEKSDDAVQLKGDLVTPLRMMQETARRIAKVSNECKFAIDEEEYVQKFRPELMDVVYAWCRGAKFAKICSMTEVFEGSVIRCLRRLEELLRQMGQAAATIGNAELEAKFASGIEKMKRDIVFANSLYL